MVRNNRHKLMARRCGYWAAARYMRKRGYPLDETIRRLLGVHPIPTLTNVVRPSRCARILDALFRWYTWRHTR